MIARPPLTPVPTDHFTTIGSTMDEAMARARRGVAGPFWIVADEQTAGRGRQGRVWVSRPGNLYATLLLTDACAPEIAPQIGFVAGVALQDSVAAVLPTHSVRLKWPNDVLVDGAKISGILLEGAVSGSGASARHAVAIGIGVNVAHHPGEMMYPTTSLQACGCAMTARGLFDGLAARMAERLAQWDGGAGFDEIRAGWMAVAAGIGQRISVRQGEQTVSGVCRGIDAQGRLLLDGESQQHCLHAGDVFL